jgi:ribonuclease PH
VEVQATAERKPFSRDELDDLLTLANKGIGELLRLQKEILHR